MVGSNQQKGKPSLSHPLSLGRSCKCSDCDEKVTEHSYDVHHKKRLSLCAGEDANALENQTVLCKSCHNRHTEAEQLALGSGRAPTIESQAGPRVKHLLDSTPKPQQVVWF